jgi:hypothetical protein
MWSSWKFFFLYRLKQLLFTQPKLRDRAIVASHLIGRVTEVTPAHIKVSGEVTYPYDISGDWDYGYSLKWEAYYDRTKLGKLSRNLRGHKDTWNFCDKTKALYRTIRV